MWVCIVRCEPGLVSKSQMSKCWVQVEGGRGLVKELVPACFSFYCGGQNTTSRYSSKNAVAKPLVKMQGGQRR